MMQACATSVGLAAAAIGKAHGAIVAATTRRPDREKLLRGNGVDQVLPVCCPHCCRAAASASCHRSFSPNSFARAGSSKLCPTGGSGI